MTSASFIAIALCALLLAACDKKAPEAPRAPAAGTPAQAAVAAMPYAGSMMNGQNTEALRGYLRAVQPVEPRKFKVKWTAATVPIDRDAALRSLLAVSPDGDSFSFDSSEPALARLQPGSILFVWGVALRKVSEVVKGEKVTLVNTVPAALQEAIADGEIEFEYGAPLRNYLVVPRKPSAGTAPARTGMWRQPGFMLASYQPEGGDPASWADKAVDWAASGNHHFKGEIKGFEYSLAFVPGDEGLAFDLQLRKGEGEEGAAADARKKHEEELSKKQNEAGQKFDEKQRAEEQRKLREIRDKEKLEPKVRSQMQGEKAAREYQEGREHPFREPAHEAGKQLMEMASDMLDMRIQAKGVLQGVNGSDRLTVFNRMVFKDGAVSLLHSQFKDISGTVDVQYIVRRGEMSEQWIEKLRLDLPVTVNVPIVVYGLPLMVQLGFDLMATPALATKHDAFRGAFTFKFGGSGGTRYSEGKPSAEAQMEGEGTAREAEALSIGVSTVLVALQAPRIGLGIGLFGASTIGYLDMVTATSVTSAGTLGMFPCKKWDSYWSINAGIDAKVGMFEKDYRTDPPLKKKEWHKISPQIKACEFKEGG